MFKIDWATAIGGAAVGYLVKGKVESTKAVVRKISTDAMTSLKESFSGCEKPQQATQGQTGQAGQAQATQGNGQNG